MISELYVTVVLPGHTRPTTAGRLRLDQSGHDLQATFVYGRRYCANPEAVELDPLRLPLDPARTFEADGLWAALGVFRDASPDYWGRRVIERSAGMPELPEAEYLLRSNATRAGALGFNSTLDATAPVAEPLRHLMLSALLDASRRLEADLPIADEALSLLRQGTSLGGARPKASVLEDDTYWLAKFPSHDDRLDIAAIEYATLSLAEQAGIHIPRIRLLVLPGGDRVLLLQRFDRDWTAEGWYRYHCMSGLTLLGLHESENARGDYSALADTLRRLSADFPADAEQLFRRMVYNILVSNDDDHLRNHALLLVPQGWRLSPAFDVVPHPQIGYERRQSIQVGRQGRASTITNALSDAARFGLTAAHAAACVGEVKKAVESWRPLFTDHGVAPAEIEQLQTAFLPDSVL